MGEKMTEREAFEKWAREKQWPVFRCDYLNDLKYEDTFVTTAWQAWQARAHLTQPAQAVAVEVRPVLVRETPEACQVWLRSGVQQFQVGDAFDTREEGEWHAGQLRIALGITAALPKDSNGAEGADGWRPIATAPKDGKEVLVAFTADGVRQVAEASWSDDEDVWVCSRDGFMLYRRNEPTHWMPLPDAPQEDTPDAAR